MFSFISNFRRELKIFGLLIAILLGAELVVRVSEPALSLDIKHIRDIPEIAELLSASKSKRILFLGNSLTRQGVDIDIFTESAKAGKPEEISVAKVFPDDTTIADWYYVFKRFFVKPQRLPDTLILGFYGSNLEDPRNIKTSALAHNFTDWDDLPEIYEHDVKDFESRADFIFSKISYCHANRERIGKRILDILIPNYRDSVYQIGKYSKGKEQGGPQRAATYESLVRFLEIARLNNVKIMIVAMPVKNKYKTDDDVIDLLRRSGIKFLDASNLERIAPDMFLDEIHLNERGAAVYSKYIGENLSHEL